MKHMHLLYFGVAVAAGFVLAGVTTNVPGLSTLYNAGFGASYNLAGS